MSVEHRGMTNSTSSHLPTVQGLVELGLPKSRIWASQDAAAQCS